MSQDDLVAEFLTINTELKKLKKRREKLRLQMIEFAKSDYDFVGSGVSVNKSNAINMKATLAAWEEKGLEIPQKFVPEQIIPEKIIEEKWINDTALIELRSKENGTFRTKDSYTVSTS